MIGSKLHTTRNKTQHRVREGKLRMKGEETQMVQRKQLKREEGNPVLQVI